MSITRFTPPASPGSVNIQVSREVRRQLEEIARLRQTELGRPGRVPFNEVIEYLLRMYNDAQNRRPQ